MSIHKKSAVTKLKVFEFAAKKSRQIHVKARNFYSLTYRYSGKISIKTENTDLLSGENSVTFMPKGVSYATEIISDMRMAVIHFTLDRNIDFRQPAVLQIKDMRIRRLFEKLIHDFRADNAVDFRCMAVFYELLAELELLDFQRPEESVPHKIRLAKEYIQQNCTDTSLSVAGIAERFEISSSYLRREFSLAYGKSPIAFLSDMRLNVAKNLLESGYLSIAETAEQSGFSSASYFIQFFRKATGESPNRYRQKTNRSQ